MSEKNTSSQLPSENFISENKPVLLTTLFIGITYLWTGSAYLAWTAHLTPLASETLTYLATEAGGCISQIIGLLLFCLLLRHDTRTALNSKIFLFIMLLDGLSILPIVCSGEMLSVLAWGIVMNLFHGAIAACYLARLSYYIPKNRRAFCFGVGYAFGSIGSYLLSLPGDGNFLGTETVWFLFALLILLGCALFLYMANADTEKESLPTREAENKTSTRITKNAVPLSSCALAGAVIILLGLTIQLLFFFPAKAYISNTIFLNFSHMFYAIGLLIAAYVNDKKRNAGLILALLSLCFPLLSLSLYQLTSLLTTLAVIGNSVTGFYSVYRTVVFVDLYDDDSRLLALAPFGLLCGRIGEAAGASLGLVIGSNHILLTITTVVLFVASIILVFLLYIRLYSEKPVTTASDRTNRFCAEFELSSKEQSVFLLLVDGKTNKEIADLLYISENTVKFHVRNILKKTDCNKRTDVIWKFQSYS